MTQRRREGAVSVGERKPRAHENNEAAKKAVAYLCSDVIDREMVVGAQLLEGQALGLSAPSFLQRGVYGIGVEISTDIVCA
jgi:hypothetical protein